MTDAEAIIRSSILEALLEVPETAEVISTEGTPEKTVTAILDAVFTPSTRWAAACYVEELNIKCVLDRRARTAEYTARWYG